MNLLLDSRSYIIIESLIDPHVAAGVTMTKNSRDTTVSLELIQEPVKEGLVELQNFIRDLILEEFNFIEEVAEHVVSMKGKLFRPALLLLAGGLSGNNGRTRELIQMAVVVEMIHMATLVHDDFIDDASIRRGLPTINDRWSEQVSIIMGDYLYSRSLIELVNVGDMKTMRLMSAACRRIALGEMMEVNLTNTLDQTEEKYYRTISEKTAALIAASCETGAVLAAPEYRENMRIYGENLGMAFQIIDDVFDYTGRSSTIGKVVGTDLREKKVTLPLLHALKNMAPDERKYMEQLFSKQGVESEDIDEVSRIIRDHGGFDYATRRAGIYARDARKALEGVEPSRHRDSLFDAVDYVVERDR